jgi:hypothetical protein
MMGKDKKDTTHKTQSFLESSASEGVRRVGWSQKSEEQYSALTYTSI